MATTLRILESPPAAYPTIPNLPTGIAAAAVWQRIESWIGWRWGVRDCVFTVEGPGEWSAPLQPAVIGDVEIWRDEDWEAVTLSPTPLGGLLLPECAHCRIEATVGDANEPPSSVLEAAARLGRFFADSADYSENVFLTKASLEGVGAFEFGPPGAMARAMQHSGAADLLRPWRNLGAE